MVSQNCPIIGEKVVVIFVTRQVTIARVRPLKTPLITALGFRVTLYFRKFKVALKNAYRIFLNFAKSCVLSCLSKVNDFFFNHNAVIKGVFSRSYCCYGNILCHENDNVFTNDRAIF